MAASATDETWWPQFVEEYGTTSLRELARRFGTNPRRLRRAAQRSGLTEEPEILRDNANMLGSAPDASVAEKLKITPEQVKGARVRRKIPPFNNQAPVARTPSASNDASVVVRRAPAPKAKMGRPSAFQKMRTPEVDAVVIERRFEGRQRRVPRPEREPIVQDAPRSPRPRQSRKSYAPVKTLFDRNDDDDGPPLLAAVLPSPPELESPAPALPRTVALPTPSPEPAPVVYFQVDVDGQSHIVRGATMVDAARAAEPLGRVRSIRPVETL